MGQTTHQIEAHIADTREKLGNNVLELERRVKAVTDWKHHVQTSPMTCCSLNRRVFVRATMVLTKYHRRTRPLTSIFIVRLVRRIMRAPTMQGTELSKRGITLKAH